MKSISWMCFPTGFWPVFVLELFQENIWLFGDIKVEGDCHALRSMLYLAKHNKSLQEAEACVRKLNIDWGSRYDVVQCSYEAQFSAVNLRSCTFSEDYTS